MDQPAASGNRTMTIVAVGALLVAIGALVVAAVAVTRTDSDPADPSGTAAATEPATDEDIDPTGTSTPTGPTDPSTTTSASPTTPPIEGTVRVPEDVDSIQAAIDDAEPGDMVLVAPGTYEEDLEIDKPLTLASHFIESGDRQDVEGTVLRATEAGIVTEPDANPGVRIVGLTFESMGEADDGISSDSVVTVEDSRFLGFADGIDTQNQAGEQLIVRRTLFRDQRDDAIDLDDATGAIIEDNVIENPHEDGIEIRLYDWPDPLDIIIRGNTIDGTGEDGVQIIEQTGEGISFRHIVIERNLMTDIGTAAVGLMDNAETDQDFRAADIDDEILVRNNTIVGTDYGISGGDNLIAVNNIVADFTGIAFWGVDGNSHVAHNLVWEGGTAFEESNVEDVTLVEHDPQLDGDRRPGESGAAIDAGVATFVHDGAEVFTIPTADYTGDAPDLGAFEFGL